MLEVEIEEGVGGVELYRLGIAIHRIGILLDERLAHTTLKQEQPVALLGGMQTLGQAAIDGEERVWREVALATVEAQQRVIHTSAEILDTLRAKAFCAAVDKLVIGFEQREAEHRDERQPIASRRGDGGGYTLEVALHKLALEG